MPVDDTVHELALSVDQLGRGAGVPRDLDQTLGVRARLRADHEDERRLLGEPLDGILAVLCGIADVIGGGTPERTEPVLESIDRCSDVVEREGRLADDRDRTAVRLEPGRFLR